MTILKKSRIMTLAAAFIVLFSAVFFGCTPYSDDSLAYQAGMEALGNDDFEIALIEFQKAAEEDGCKAEAYRGTGLVYLKQGNYKYAVSFFDIRLKEMKRENSEFREDVLWYKAEALMKNGQYEDAIAVYTELCEASRPAVAYAYRGRAYLISGDITSAENDFITASETEKSYDIYIYIYEAYRAANLEDNGTPYLEKAIEINPSGAGDYQKLGTIYDYLEDDRKAEEYLKKAIDSGYDQAIPVQADLYIKNGQTEEAKALYLGEIESGKTTAENYNGLALCFMAAGEYEQALQYISIGLEAANEDEKRDLLYNEIVVYERMLDFETAKVKAEEYLAKYPTDASINREIKFLSR